MSDPGISPVDDFDSQQRRDDDIDREHVGPYEVDEAEESLETVTNDAVAGETVEPQPGDGSDDGPTGGSPREGSPDLWEHENEQDEDRADLGNDLGTKPL
ncbi:hypothetical protein NY546_06345 [Curtobacterium flaccumfaciens pv. flaccumfaciens]|uniref:hypothetical protein n=1 Tax=Curtobacterium TaxID=2034 RepID=UPI0012F46981|nr:MULTISPECIES: hypothetical protein [Curtobacterium]MCS5508910.1 hypothetical protein [Curtobacterium flaccumfaciens pv. flaccumfaciens]MCX2786282.1 hypothetical protein [Curtobacterium flaccumfaciens pv. flaccumfaciens]QKS88834.1 hypothetical protein FK523_15710 [Curtobacterium flaccumfaciens pv. flaccumfaciens]UXZ57528.1 hypothetical protein MXD64_16280 [Curtobacterium sp. Arg-1]VXB31537.1 conserved hypothetical protein [Curtobacterium sp. 8I-2]